MNDVSEDTYDTEYVAGFDRLYLHIYILYLVDRPSSGARVAAIVARKKNMHENPL